MEIGKANTGMMIIIPLYVVLSFSERWNITVSECVNRGRHIVCLRATTSTTITHLHRTVVEY